MRSESNLEYYTRRELEELRAAETCAPDVRCVHLALARRYAARLVARVATTMEGRPAVGLQRGS